MKKMEKIKERGEGGREREGSRIDFLVRSFRSNREKKLFFSPEIIRVGIETLKEFFFFEKVVEQKKKERGLLSFCSSHL